MLSVISYSLGHGVVGWDILLEERDGKWWKVHIGCLINVIKRLGEIAVDTFQVCFVHFLLPWFYGICKQERTQCSFFFFCVFFRLPCCFTRNMFWISNSDSVSWLVHSLHCECGNKTADYLINRPGDVWYNFPHLHNSQCWWPSQIVRLTNCLQQTRDHTCIHCI